MTLKEDIKIDSEKLENDAAEYLDLFQTKMKGIAQGIIEEIFIELVPHIESDMFTNYRQYLKNIATNELLNNDWRKSWATEIRRQIFKENKQEVAELIGKDIVDRIKSLEDSMQTYNVHRYTPSGDSYRDLKNKLDKYIEKYGELKWH